MSSEQSKDPMTNPDLKDMKVGKFYYDPKQDFLNEGAPNHGEFFFVDDNDEVIGRWFMVHGHRVSKTWFYSIVTDSTYARNLREYHESLTKGIQQFYQEGIMNSDNLFFGDGKTPEIMEPIDYYEGSDGVYVNEENGAELFNRFQKMSKEVTRDD